MADEAFRDTKYPPPVLAAHRLRQVEALERIAGALERLAGCGHWPKHVDGLCKECYRRTVLDREAAGDDG